MFKNAYFIKVYFKDGSNFFLGKDMDKGPYLSSLPEIFSSSKFFNEYKFEIIEEHMYIGEVDCLQLIKCNVNLNKMHVVEEVTEQKLLNN